MKAKTTKGRNAARIVMPEPPANMGPLARKIDAAFRDIFAGNVTVREVEITEPRVYTPKDVRALRDRVGVSQRVFAHIVGVSPELIESWEQGVREPAPLARRLLETIDADPIAFTRRVILQGKAMRRPHSARRRVG
ncbi:MAG: higA-2 [Phycisphaerales bacterium]|jgi:putative transcriptional regulator|nr:higA-2 [Phycisphaerales bacterium]